MPLYPAFFELRQEGGYTVVFPDLPGCFTEGDDDRDAARLARDALHGHIQALGDLKRPVPAPSAFSALLPPAGAFLVLVEGPPEPSRTVRINVSFDANLLRRVDAAAKERGLTRSGVLAAACRFYMSQG